MNAVTSLIKRYPQATFWVIAWSTFFYGYAMYIRSGNEMWQFLILATFLGGVFVTGIADGRAGLKTYFSRIVRWRVHIKWYAIAIGLPLVLRLAAFGVTLVTGAKMVANPTWSVGDIIFDIILVFFVIALGEEPAFRGFALVKLMKNNNALKASLLLGVFHVFWHLPLFLTGDDSPMVILIIMAGTILNTWLFNNTKGSVLLNMIMHTSVNFWADIFNPMFTPGDAANQTTYLMIGYIAVAILITAISGVNLSRKDEVESSAVTAEPTLAAS